MKSLIEFSPKTFCTAFFVFLSVWVSGQQSHEVTFEHEGLTVHGTLTTPEGTGRFPTIIITPGTGASDRDGTNPLTDPNSACLFPVLFNDTLRIYKDLSVAFVDSGYAVLRYDKLEFTYTPAELAPISFHKLWLPVESAIDYIKTRPDVDTTCIILLGHSEGSALIPIIAKNRNDIMALISVAGARTPFDSLLAFQLVNLVELLRPCGATDADSIQAAAIAAQVYQYFNLIRTNNWDVNTPSFAGVSASTWYEYITSTDSVAIHYNEAQLPSLFIGLGADIQVPPSELERFKNEVTITDDFWNIPGLTHFMTPTIIPHVSETLTDTIISWLRMLKMSTGTKDVKGPLDSFLHISPNPFTSLVHIEYATPLLNPGSVSVFDTIGNLVYHKDMDAFDETGIEIELGFLSSGMYMIQIVSGKHTFSKQIFRQ